MVGRWGGGARGWVGGRRGKTELHVPKQSNCELEAGKWEGKFSAHFPNSGDVCYMGIAQSLVTVTSVLKFT